MIARTTSSSPANAASSSNDTSNRAGGAEPLGEAAELAADAPEALRESTEPPGEPAEASGEAVDVGSVVEAGVVVFRRFALQHPALFRLGVQHVSVPADLVQGFRGAADHALDGLQRRVVRLADAGRLGGRPLCDAIWEFHALCEGLAALELRCLLPDDDAERLWRDALAALVTNTLAASPQAISVPLESDILPPSGS